MSIFNIYDTAHNGLQATRGAMELAAENVANMLTPGYKAKSPVFAAKVNDSSFSTLLSSLGSEDGEIGSIIKGEHKGEGVQIAKVMVDNTPGIKVFMPDHPMADANGNVEMSNVDGAGEMLKMMDAVRQYKANLSIVEMAKKASQEALNMTKNS